MSEPKYLTNDEFRRRLRDAGWPEDEIERELERMFDDAEEEAGYDGP